MRVWLIIAGVLIVLPALIRVWAKFVLAPIRIHSTHRFTLRPQWRHTTIEELTPQMQEFTGRMVRQFKSEGFEAVANVNLPDAVTAAQSFQVLMVHPESGDVAVPVAVRTRKRCTFSLFVRSEFSDGTRVITSSTQSGSFFPKNPADDAVNFRWVSDAASLCEAHRRRLARLGKSGIRRDPPQRGREFEYLGKHWARSADWFVRCGYHYRDEAAGVQRLTWKGAILATWKLQQPIKRWRIRLKDRRARKLWRELGMNEWSAPTGNAPALPSMAIN